MKTTLKQTVVTLTLVLLAVVNCPAAESAGTLDPVSGKPCYVCHRSKVTGTYVHDALAGNECASCHAATGGDHQRNRALYAAKDKSVKLCYECHDSQANKKSVHMAIDEVACIGCHAPHNSSLKNLLRSKVPALCFQCHDRALLEQKETAKATGFRDGVQNLHFAHAGQNGIPCLACHDEHASSQLHLIRPKGTNGKDAVTITYTAGDKGGTCATSCHDTLSYERK